MGTSLELGDVVQRFTLSVMRCFLPPNSYGTLKSCIATRVVHLTDRLPDIEASHALSGIFFCTTVSVYFRIAPNDALSLDAAGAIATNELYYA